MPLISRRWGCRDSGQFGEVRKPSFLGKTQFLRTTWEVVKMFFGFNIISFGRSIDRQVLHIFTGGACGMMHKSHGGMMLKHCYLMSND